MYFDLDDLKKYIDSLYGEDNGDVISEVLRCSFNSKGDLEFKVWLGSLDSMCPIATLTKEGWLYLSFIDVSSDFYIFADEFLDDLYTTEDVYKLLLSFIICEYDDELSRMREIVTTLNELKDKKAEIKKDVRLDEDLPDNIIKFEPNSVSGVNSKP